MNEQPSTVCGRVLSLLRLNSDLIVVQPVSVECAPKYFGMNKCELECAWNRAFQICPLRSDCVTVWKVESLTAVSCLFRFFTSLLSYPECCVTIIPITLSVCLILTTFTVCVISSDSPLSDSVVLSEISLLCIVPPLSVPHNPNFLSLSE